MEDSESIWAHLHPLENLLHRGTLWREGETSRGAMYPQSETAQVSPHMRISHIKGGTKMSQTVEIHMNCAGLGRGPMASLSAFDCMCCGVDKCPKEQ